MCCLLIQIPRGASQPALDIWNLMRFQITLANVLTAVINEEEIDPAGGILHHEEDIDIMPGEY